MSLNVYSIVNFKSYKINRGVYKLDQKPIVIKKKRENRLLANCHTKKKKLQPHKWGLRKEGMNLKWYHSLWNRKDMWTAQPYA